MTVYHDVYSDLYGDGEPPTPPPAPAVPAVPPVSVVWDGLELNPGHLDGGDTTVVVENVEGWYATPGLDGHNVERALADGSVLGPKTLAAREITLTGAVAGPRQVLAEWRDQLAQRAAARLPAELLVGDPGQPGPMTAEVRADSDQLSHQFLGGHQGFRWQVTLTAADPRLYGTPWQEAVLTTGPGETGRTYPTTYPWDYGGAAPSQARLENTGDAPAPVLATWEGPLPASRLQAHTGEWIALQAIGDETVLVQTENLLAEAPGGWTRGSYVLAGSQPMTIPPRSTVTWTLYAAGPGPGQVVLNWRPVWL